MRGGRGIRRFGLATAAGGGLTLLIVGAAADTTAPDVDAGQFADTGPLDTLLDGPAEPDPVDWDEVDPRIRAAAQEKLDEWLGRRENECVQLALKRAEFRADSMILDYARDLNLQSTGPGRPLRPNEPPLLRPSDTLRLRPFFE